MGPNVLFDKSFLHSLSVDEAAVFDALFTSNITPLFFVETLADLRKEMKDGRTPEQVVGNLALKTPKMHSYPNAQHLGMCVSELMGSPIEMRGVPAVSGGQTVRTGANKQGLVFEPAPEMVALRRWEEGQFLRVEHDFAASWRAAVQNTPRGINSILGPDGNKLKLADLSAVEELADSLIDSGPNRWLLLKACMEMAGLRLKWREQVADRWKRAGRPLLKEFAPYCAHVLRVELIFNLGVATGQLHDERPTNRVDLAYLHYAPFCEIFVSGDKLHRRLAPMFLNERQRFVWAHDLKKDLGKLVTHYAAHPDIATEGLMRLATYPPLAGDFLVTALNDELRPKWRERATAPKIEIPPEKHAELMADMNALKAARRAPRSGPMALPPTGQFRDSDQITFERHVPLRWGRWQFMPADLKADC
ncbi:hypothetical protein LJR225_000731 [Phenylobacterium sp. LjRoot225]|uniref:hypothetical protein n=1 Tax=Phenylobacterium sp. LjRoot225 TaxID=3342285 RepID=UPI003ECEC257